MMSLTYCLNIHPGEEWRENFEAISKYALEVKRLVSPKAPFGLGMRLSRAAADSLSRPAELQKFREFLAANDLYVFTINGFPYGKFHKGKVKAEVYRPDWRAPERKEYTLILARILAALLPDGVTGSISTVPVTFKPWTISAADRKRVDMHLLSCVEALARIRAETGKEIALALEPEPDCFIERTQEAIDYFEGHLLKSEADGIGEEKIRRHLGICLDTCHFAVNFEKPSDALKTLTAHGIKIPKIQLSAALKMAVNDRNLGELARFCDAVYLHQTKVRDSAGNIDSFTDLTPETLEEMRAKRYPAGAELRSHFHVPLFLERTGGIESTSSEISRTFLEDARAAGVEQFEVETYTFDVLPRDLRCADVTGSIARELEWVMRQ